MVYLEAVRRKGTSYSSPPLLMGGGGGAQYYRAAKPIIALQTGNLGRIFNF
jgi:hypothetical protein